MRRLTRKEVIRLAVAQNKFKIEFRMEFERLFARYQLRIITEEELFVLLSLKK